jgi:CHASE2 domain-containing sensor protein
VSDSIPEEPKTSEVSDPVEPVEEPEEGEPTQSVEEGHSDGDRRNEEGEGEQEAQPAQPAHPAPVSVPDMNPASRLSHHLSYEITQAAVVAGVLGILAFVVLGGRLADVYLWLRPTAPTSGQVTLLTVGEEALYLFDPSDPSPEVTPRALLAELVRFAHAGGASVVVLDFLLDRPCENDELLASAAREHGAVVGAERFVVSDPGTGREFAAGPAVGFGDAVATGFANLHEEQHALFSSGDLLVRRTPLVRRVAWARQGGAWPMGLVGGDQADAQVRPSMPLLAAWLHTSGSSAVDLQRRLDAGCGGSPMSCDLDAAELGLPELPGDLNDLLEINYRGAEGRDEIPTLRAAQVLRAAGESALMRSVGVELPLTVPADMAEVLRGRVVVICRVDEVAAAAGDRFVTPYAFPLLLSADMTGGRIQAQVIDNLLAGHHIRHLGAWLPLLLTGLLLAGIWLTRRRLREDVHTALWCGVAAALVLAGVALFRATDGLVADLELPVAAVMVSLIALRLRGWALEDQIAD